MAVREGLLALLDDGPRHGYQLKTNFEAATGGVWPLNVGQVYTTLDRLERDGLVDAEATDDADGSAGKATRIYTITQAGVEVLGGWWEAIPAEDPPPRDELMLKVLLAVEHGPAQGLRVITHQRSALFALLMAHRKTARSVAADQASAAPTPAEQAARMVDDALVVRAEADLRWLDLCEARLQRADSTESNPATAAHEAGSPGMPDTETRQR